VSAAEAEHLVLYGLRIESQLALRQQRVTGDDGPVDLNIRLGRPIESTETPPPGRLLLDLEMARRLYCATEDDEGRYVLRCHRICDFAIDRDLRNVTVHIVSGANPDMAAVLATGTLLSFILAIGGHTVLHASAVEVDDVALAFVGASGMGKSTMAALMCSDGAALITDDVLRLDVEEAGGQPTCHLGATELRLRKAVGDLAERFHGAVEKRRTSDGRDALRMPGSARDGLPLVGIVIPMPDHDSERVTPEIERLDAKSALLGLLQFPRILGWRDRGILDRHFHQLGEVVARVPVYRARMPWGPPFPAGIAETVTDAVGIGSAHSPGMVAR
jgi:hypothetical protein